MTEIETELDSRYDNIDVESILSKIGQRSLVFARKKCLYHAPEFIQRLPPEQTVEEGTTVTFGCKVVGFPKPSITWYKDDDCVDSHSRAIINSDETGFHFINLQEVSKCDAGKYKVRASNLEGSSSSMLYLSVKDKSKCRNRKKKKTRAVACAPLFPAIVEHEAEENRQTKEVELQPESPLTPIYSSNSRRSPVVWPPFLGEWAYSGDEYYIHKDEDLEVGCEDVFDDDCIDSPTQEGLIFVSSEYANKLLNIHDEVDGPLSQNIANDSCPSIENCTQDCTEDLDSNKITDKLKTDTTESCPQRDTETTKSDTVIENYDQKELIPEDDDVSNVTSLVSGIADNNNKRDKDVTELNNVNTELSNGTLPTVTNNFVAPSIEHAPDENTIYMDESTIRISVNRSYAKGDKTKTFSVATRRSPSPYTENRNTLSKQNGGQSRCTSTLQNLNNERILTRMRQLRYTNSWWWKCLTSRASNNLEDHFLEVILLLCGCTFLALYFEIPPGAFVADVFVALVIKAVLVFIFSET